MENRRVNVFKGFIFIIVVLWSLLVLGFFAMVGYSWYGIPGAVAIDLVLIWVRCLCYGFLSDKFRYEGKYKL